MEHNEVERLAQLARIQLNDSEIEDLTKDITEILAFVTDVQQVETDRSAEGRIGAVHNVLREDENPHESGVYTDELLAEAPATRDGYIKVKKIL